MHEMGLAQGILAIALDAAGGQQVRLIRMRVGKRQMVARDSLEFSFRLISEDTAAAQARLAMEEVPIYLRCSQCAAEGEADFPPWNCRACGASEVEVLSGDELLVDAVELESGQIIRRRATGGP